MHTILLVSIENHRSSDLSTTKLVVEPIGIKLISFEELEIFEFPVTGFLVARVKRISGGQWPLGNSI